MDSAIRFAEKKDIPALCEIWKACFPDSDDYLRCFYEENFERIKVLIYEADGKAVCMSHIIDAVFKDGDRSENAMYLYAGGTLPGYRHRGYFAETLREIMELATRSGKSIFFKPATELLAEFYREFAFRPDACLKLVTIQPEGKTNLKPTDISYTEFNHMRENALSGMAHVCWPDEHIRWSVKENKLFSGRTFKFEYMGGEHFMMAYPEGKSCIITETDLSVSEIRDISAYLCGLFKTENLKAYMPGDCPEGEAVTSSFVYNTKLRNVYVNQILI